MPNNIETGETAAADIADNNRSEAPVGDETQINGDDRADELPGDAAQEEKPVEVKRDLDKDRIYADARRRAEADARRQLDKVISESGLRNPFDGNKPITTKAEHDAYLKKRAENSVQKAETLLRRAGMTDEEIDEYKASLPEVAEARRLTDENRAQQAKAAVAAELAEISKLDPSVKTVEDLRALENWEDIAARLRRGYSLRDAFVSSSFEGLKNRDSVSSAAASAAAGNSVNKSHMQTVGNRSGGVEKNIAVPADAYAEYKRLYPNMSDKEIRQSYARYQQGTKKLK